MLNTFLLPCLLGALSLLITFTKAQVPTDVSLIPADDASLASASAAAYATLGAIAPCAVCASITPARQIRREYLHT